MQAMMPTASQFDVHKSSLTGKRVKKPTTDRLVATLVGLQTAKLQTGFLLHWLNTLRPL